jgi:hypothetical protein
MDNDQATLNEPVEEQSMDDTIRQTLESIKERDSDASAELEANAAQNEEKPAEQRAPDGKFAKATDESKQATEQHTDAAAQPESAGTAVAENAAPTAEPVAAAPSSWTAAGKAEWAKIPEGIRQEVLKREADFHKGVEQYRAQANFAQAVHKAIAPYESTLRQLNIAPDVAINSLLSADHKLRNGSPAEKLQNFAQLAQMYGIDLSQGLPQTQQIDPNTQYLQQQLQQTQQKLQHLSASQAQREQAELNSMIEQAKQGKEHFDVVRKEMAALLEAGTAKDINQAYDMAVWARPDLRANLLAKQQEEQRAAQAKIAQKAKATAATNVPRRGTLPAQRPVGTMDETLKATLADIRSRS